MHRLDLDTMSTTALVTLMNALNPSPEEFTHVGDKKAFRELSVIVNRRGAAKRSALRHECQTAYKWAADLSGYHLDIPEELNLPRDYVVTIYDKAGDPVFFDLLERHPNKLIWKRWVRKSHGYPGAQDPREKPAGDYEPFEIEENHYRAVIIF